jgi:hypothetical protein
MREVETSAVLPNIHICKPTSEEAQVVPQLLLCKMGIPFIFWYIHYVALSTVHRVTVQYFCMNMNKIITRRISYIFVSCF